MENIHLLIIDPQFDFCHHTGSLYVPGAEDDMLRVSKMIQRLGSKLSEVHVTLDQHHLIDIAHPLRWQGQDGNPPPPFTIISTSDIANDIWIPVQGPHTVPTSILKDNMIRYTEELRINKRYSLCIWPPHCLIGTRGATVAPMISDALNEWCAKNRTAVNFIFKGLSKWTEHYSAIQAEVPDPLDLTTLCNMSLINELVRADKILIAGEAGSHCVANTVKDIADIFSSDFSCYNGINKLTLLTNSTSPVPGFEQLQTDFIKDMIARGMGISTCEEVLK